MTADEGSERRWTIALIVMAILFMLTPNIASYRAGYQNGLEAGQAQERERHEWVKAQLRATGLCEWPAAFYKAANCGDTHD